MKPEQKPSLTVSQYIEAEKTSGVRHEFHAGQIYLLAGGPLNHGLLCGNVYSELRAKLAVSGSNCKALTSEVKLEIAQNGQKGSFVYPDAMVICGDIEKSQKDKNAITNPAVIVEVLSRSTADYDRGDKFHLYRQIPTIQEYVLIEQHRAQVEVYYKKPKVDLWQITRVEGLDSTLYLQSIDVKILLQDLYFDIDFESA